MPKASFRIFLGIERLLSDFIERAFPRPQTKVTSSPARDVFTYRVELLWKKTEPIIQGLRKELNQPEAGKWFEYLYNELEKRKQRQ
jgi:hypothetical protein